MAREGLDGEQGMTKGCCCCCHISSEKKGAMRHSQLQIDAPANMQIGQNNWKKTKKKKRERRTVQIGKHAAGRLEDGIMMRVK